MSGAGNSEGAALLWPVPVPRDWQLAPIKRQIARIDSGVSVNALDQPADPGVPGVLKTSCVYTGEFDPRENKAVVEAERHLVACPVRMGSLIVSRMNTPDLVGAAGLVREPAPDIYLPDRLWQISFTELNPRFVHYWTRSLLYRLNVQLACAGTSASMQNLSQEDFRGFPIAVPDRNTQAALSEWLDRETARIDALVEKKTRFIELLLEKRQAVVTRAVTRGLDPMVPMKNSGVEWLGHVPVHWDVGRLGRCINIVNGYAFQSEQFSQDKNDCRLLRGVNVIPAGVRWDDVAYWRREPCDGMDGFALKVGDIVLGLDRTWISTGTRVARITEGDLPCLLLQRVAAIRPSSSLSDDFLFYLLGSDMMRFALFADQTGLSVPHISSIQIERFVVALPPVEEQMRICRTLHGLLKRIDQLQQATDRSIRILHERRAALITAAVTGQVDLREAA